MKLINRVVFAYCYIVLHAKSTRKTHANENVNVMSAGCLLVAAFWLAAFW